jgi:hypothetical protein
MDRSELNRAHTEALEENAAHDAAVAAAQDLDSYLATLNTGPMRLPQTLRTRDSHRRLSSIRPR